MLHPLSKSLEGQKAKSWPIGSRFDIFSMWRNTSFFVITPKRRPLCVTKTCQNGRDINSQNRFWNINSLQFRNLSPFCNIALKINQGTLLTCLSPSFLNMSMTVSIGVWSVTVDGARSKDFLNLQWNIEVKIEHSELNDGIALAAPAVHTIQRQHYSHWPEWWRGGTHWYCRNDICEIGDGSDCDVGAKSCDGTGFDYAGGRGRRRAAGSKDVPRRRWRGSGSTAGRQLQSGVDGEQEITTKNKTHQILRFAAIVDKDQMLNESIIR